ncbi:hypothetical protein MUN38_12995 [Corynebacterium callunae]|nr:MULTISPECIES: hypothetical protein [Corynebacterium]MCK2201633.1 hypothetical protein [Corynebacterium callunae]
MFLIYRNRYIFWSDKPMEAEPWPVLCGAVWTEKDVEYLAELARRKGYLLLSAEVPLAFKLDATIWPESVFIPGELALSQDDPFASEFSNFFPKKAYLTFQEAAEVATDWDEIWEFRMPWLSKFILSPFELESFQSASMDPHRFSF